MQQMARCRAKRDKIWDLWEVLIVYTGHFLLLSVEGQSEVIRCISDFRQPSISKTAGHGAKRTNIGASWVRTSGIHCTLPLKCVGHSDVHWCSSDF